MSRITVDGLPVSPTGCRWAGVMRASVRYCCNSISWSCRPRSSYHGQLTLCPSCELHKVCLAGLTKTSLFYNKEGVLLFWPIANASESPPTRPPGRRFPQLSGHDALRASVASSAAMPGVILCPFPVTDPVVSPA
jgi:hypothetical protein